MDEYARSTDMPKSQQIGYVEEFLLHVYLLDEITEV